MPRRVPRNLKCNIIPTTAQQPSLERKLKVPPLTRHRGRAIQARVILQKLCPAGQVPNQPVPVRIDARTRARRVSRERNNQRRLRAAPRAGVAGNLERDGPVPLVRLSETPVLGVRGTDRVREICRAVGYQRVGVWGASVLEAVRVAVELADLKEPCLVGYRPRQQSQICGLVCGDRDAAL